MFLVILLQALYFLLITTSNPYLPILPFQLLEHTRTAAEELQFALDFHNSNTEILLRSLFACIFCNQQNDSWTAILERMSIMSTMSTTAKMFIGSSFLHLSLYWYCLSTTNGETEHIVDFNPEATDAHSVAAYGVLIVGADC